MRTFCIIGVVFLLIDVGTKQLAVSSIAPLSWYAYYPFGGVGLFSLEGVLSCSINLIYNRGVAFGLFSEYFFYVLAIRVILVGALVVAFVKTYSNWKRSGFMCVIVGAIGNVLDHLWYEGSVDMIHFRFFNVYTFPLFNFADMLIFFGVIMLLFVKEDRVLREEKPTLAEVLERARNR